MKIKAKGQDYTITLKYLKSFRTKKHAENWARLKELPQYRVSPVGEAFAVYVPKTD